MVNQTQLHIVAVTGFVEREGKFLILKRSEKEIAHPGEWTVPGGKVEGKDSILKTLKKEVKEETGIDIGEDCEFLGDSEFTRPDGYHVVIPQFLCKAKEGKVEIDKNDFTDFAWIGLDELDKFDLIPGIKKDFEQLKSKQN